MSYQLIEPHFRQLYTLVSENIVAEDTGQAGVLSLQTEGERAAMAYLLDSGFLKPEIGEQDSALPLIIRDLGRLLNEK